MNQEISNIQSLTDFELLKYFQEALITRATGGTLEEDLYNTIRLKLISNPLIVNKLPSWIKQHRSTQQFWSFMKIVSTTYQGRREFLWSEFDHVLTYLESKTISPLDVVAFDELYIHKLWEKAIERKTNDPEGAITLARALIESVIKHILDGLGMSYTDNTDLSEMYKEVSKALNLAPEQHQEQIFKQILGGANGIVSGLGSLRNKLGDAHGKGKNHVKPKARHSELAVNLAGTMGIFLFKTYNEEVKNS